MLDTQLITFRGKSIRTKKWVYGYYWTNECGNHFIRHAVDLNGCLTIQDEEVDKETIGQWIGLHDFNSKMIFTGDIVYVKEEDENGVISYATLSSKYIVDFDGWATDFDSLFGRDVEIIGNIYDNKNLL